MEEIWKDVKGYEGLYQVSSLGRVRSLDRDVYQEGRIQHYKGVIMSPFISKTGYYTIRLSKDNHKHTFTVHRLVCIAFLQNVNNYPCINHKDEDKLNDHADNLEWCTYKYNSNYGSAPYRNVLKKEKFGHNVCKYSLEGNLITTYSSIREAAKANGVSRTSVGECVRGDTHQCGGFIYTRQTTEVPLPKITPVFGKNSAYPVIQYDLDLNPIKEYKSAHAAQVETGISAENISCCCRGDGITAGGFYWSLKGSVPRRLTRKNQKVVIQYDMDMNELRRFESVRAASDFMGGGKSAGIKQCIYGKNRIAYGYIWRYANEEES